MLRHLMNRTLLTVQQSSSGRHRLGRGILRNIATHSTKDSIVNYPNNEEKLVIIDTDAGTDDAHAIFMALQAHKNPNSNFRILGIVCVNGNTGVQNVCRNVSRVLQTAEVENIPIYRGAGTPLVRNYVHKDDPPYHGYDGFGDVFPESSITPKIEEEHGAHALVRLVNEYKNKLSILALGPLTNLALAVKLDPNIGNNVKEVYAMGGNMEGVGNTTVSAEFNFAVDPESAFVVLSSYACLFRIIPWEVCLRQATPYEWRTDVLGTLKSPAATLMNQVESKLLPGAKESERWIPCDQIAAAALMQPSVVLKEKSFHCTVELDGTHTRGLMVVDHASVLRQAKNVNIITRIDGTLLRKLLIWGLESPLVTRID